MTATRSHVAAATGRILIWRGGSLWIGRGGEPARAHAHHAIQVSLAFPGDRVKVRVPGGAWKSHEAFIVAAQQRHEFDARDQRVAQLFVEPESRDGRGLQLRHRRQGIAPLEPALLGRVLATLVQAYEERADDSTLKSLAQDAIGVLAETAGCDSALDSRIARAVERVRGRLDQRITLGDIATAAHLSPERFRHLFVEQTGVRFRAYVLWLRLEVALGKYVAGASLTDAAHAGGFADSAHLSRTFRQMFGISAASIHFE
jgi:AraC family transcriptional regulator